MNTTTARANGPLPPITVSAINSASTSTGSIHDDEKAREMGYRGGLVPGVTVLAYMTRMMDENFGHQWAIGGSFHGLIRRPAYEGDEMTVEGDIVDAVEGVLTLKLRVVDPEGKACATADVTCRMDREDRAR